MNKLKLLVAIAGILALPLMSVPAQEYGINWTKYSVHVTTKTTITPVATTVRLNTAVICVSGAGSSWTITIQDKGTPKILYSATAVAGTTVIALPVGIQMTGGIDIVSGGSTAGTADIWLTYR